MQGDSNAGRARLRGLLFEPIILKLLEENGYSEINYTVDNRIKSERNNFIEFRGRGGWHQIDCPCDYEYSVPFIFPIRVLAEVKFYKNPIQKHLIREYIGVMKDIQENYFYKDDIESLDDRYTELGVYFSASGYSDESIQLAFAHNIKTISYKNVLIIEDITNSILEMEGNYFRYRYCISKNNQNPFLSSFKQLLNNELDNIEEFIFRYNIPEGFERILNQLLSSIKKIKTNFFATTSGGALIHFISDSKFPKELFSESDEGNVTIHYEVVGEKRKFYLRFSGDNEARKFHFNPPESLKLSAFLSERRTLELKEKIFKTISINIRINKILRTLKLKLDNDWFNAQLESAQN